MEKNHMKTKGINNSGGGGSGSVHDNDKKSSKNKNTHVKAYYLTYGLKKSTEERNDRKKMHSQSKQTTTKHIQMRAYAFSVITFRSTWYLANDRVQASARAQPYNNSQQLHAMRKYT